MSLMRTFTVSLLLAGAMIGCSKAPSDESTAASSAPAEAPVTAPTETAPAVPAEAAPAAPAEAPVSAPMAAVTGIAECDDFLTAYEKCLAEKMPAESRAQFATGMEQWKTAWKGMADNAATRDALPGVCKQARDATVPSLTAYGCTF